jgi:formylglycine-generating enzyme required for sulfatase activity
MEPNNWGLTETVGNVWELTSPWAEDPDLVILPDDNIEIRGGSFAVDCMETTSAATMIINANEMRYDTGFRVVRTVGLVKSREVRIDNQSPW